MPESELHRRATKVLRPGDLVGQPFGDPFRIARVLPAAAYSGDDETRRLQADVVLETMDEQRVHIEFEVTNPVTREKLERLRKAGVHRVLVIKLLSRCEAYSDDQLREYIEKGNSVLKGPGQPLTHDWLYMAPSVIDSDRPLSAPHEIERIDEDFLRHKCFVKGCDKPVVHAVWGTVSEDVATRQGELLPGSIPFVPQLPIYACEDHMLEASLKQLPEGAEKGWWDHLRDYHAQQGPEQGHEGH